MKESCQPWLKKRHVLHSVKLQDTTHVVQQQPQLSGLPVGLAASELASVNAVELQWRDRMIQKRQTK